MCNFAAFRRHTSAFEARATAIEGDALGVVGAGRERESD